MDDFGLSPVSRPKPSALAPLLLDENCDLAKAISRMTDYVINNEHTFVVEEIGGFENFQEWKEYVLDDTVYGQAMKVQFANVSDAELNRTLVEIWDQHC
jgi:hypothetical protein